MSQRRMFVHIWVFLLLTLWCALASAHGNNPLPKSFYEFEDGSWVLVTTFGVMHDQDPTHYVCEEAFLGGADFLVAPLSRNTWVVASEAGMHRTEDGCNFDKIADWKTRPASLIPHPDQKQVLLLANDETIKPLWWSEDEGKTFAKIDFPDQKDVQWTGVRFSGDGEALVSGYLTGGDKSGASRVLRVDLKTAQASVVDETAWENVTYFYLYDTFEKKFAGLGSKDGKLVVLIGEEGKETITHEVDMWPTSIVWGKDGSLLAGISNFDGGYVWEGVPQMDGSYMWSKRYEGHSVQCISEYKGETVLCAQRAREGHDLSLMKGDMAVSMLEFKELEGPRTSCAPDSQVAQTCPLVWDDLGRSLQILEPEPEEDMGSMQAPDMGGADMGASADMSNNTIMDGDMSTTTGEKPTNGSCLCVVSRTPRMPSGPMTLLGLLVLGMGVFVRRRKKGVV